MNQRNVLMSLWSIVATRILQGGVSWDSANVLEFMLATDSTAEVGSQKYHGSGETRRANKT